jgi:hypothetical protein
VNNGKGDAPRPVNLKVYRENYAAINWGKSKRPTLNAERSTSNTEFMRTMGYECVTEAKAYRLRGLLDL